MDNLQEFLKWQQKFKSTELTAARDFFLHHINRYQQIDLMHYHNNGLGALYSVFRNVEDDGEAGLIEGLKAADQAATTYFTRPRVLADYRENLATIFPEEDLRRQAEVHLATLESFRDMLRDEFQPAIKSLLSSIQSSHHYL